MKLSTVRASLLLTLPVLMLFFSGCDVDDSQYADTQSVTSATQATAINSNLTQQNNQAATDTYAAEAYYQQLLAQYGENYQECLEPVVTNLDAVTQSNATEQKLPAIKQQNVIFALDASDSMRAFIGSSTKFDIAKAAIARFVSMFPATTQVGVTVFGDRNADDTTDPTAYCAASENMYSIAQLSNLNLTQANDFPITNYKPIAATLLRLNEVLKKYNGTTHQNIIYLISDGVDNCDRNIVEVARELHDSEAEIVVNTISLNEDETIQQQLQAIAKAGGGKYFLARNATEFDTTFERANQSSEADKYTTATIRIENQNQSNSSTPNVNQITACVTVKLNRELGQTISQINRLSTLEGTNLKYNDYVLGRLKERQDRIAAWRERLQKSANNPQNLDLNLFRQELAKATQ